MADGARLTIQQMANSLLAAGFSRAQIPIMVAIGLAESGGDPSAVNHNRNGSTDYGWLQINSVHGFDVNELMTPVGNARAGKKVYDKQGYSAWTVYKIGAYRKFLGQEVDTAAENASDTGSGSPESGGVHREFEVPSWLKPFAFITALGSPELWRRIGMGAAGVLILIVAAVAYLRKPVLDAVKAVK